MSHYMDKIDEQEYWKNYRDDSFSLKNIADHIETIKPGSDKSRMIHWLWHNKEKIYKLRKVIDLIDS